MKTKIFIIVISSLAAALLLTSCLISEEVPNTPVSPNITMTNTEQITLTAIPSLPYTPTTEPTKIPEATWAPRPTLSEAEAFDLVDDLLRNNAGCRLPCLWGITPGITTWDEANHFFASFASEIKIGYRPSTNGVLYTGRGENSGVISFVISDNGIVTMIQMFEITSQFIGRLDSLLIEHGLPDQIFIKTFDNSPDFTVYFTLILYYEEQRILAFYEYEGHLKGDIIQACPSPEGAKNIILWAEGAEFAVEESIIDLDIFGTASLTHLRNLEDVTDYSYESFYQIFTDPTYSNCIETPAEHW